jgi:16S rRNA (cytosine967-C5)-methyltransferase
VGGVRAEERLRDLPWEALPPPAALVPALSRVLAGEAAERVLPRLLRGLPGLDRRGRAAVAEAVFGVGLWRRRLAWQLGEPDPAPPRLLAALLRDLGDRADAERLAGLPAGSLPPPRPPPPGLADRWSLPDWLAGELGRAAGEQAPALAEALCRPGPIVLRVNPLRASAAEVAGRLAAEGVSTRPGRLAPLALEVTGPRPNLLGLGPVRRGWCEVQDEGSQLVAAAVGARPGEAVLDLCAGAGGKSLALAAAVGPGGRVHACDPDPERLSRLRARARRAGAGAIVAVHGEASPPDLVVDRVLVDAPCSELGPLRRGPDLRWRLDPASFAALPALQRALLERALTHLVPGGRLVYATCTIRREENEAVVEALEAAHPALRRVRPEVPAEVVGPDGLLRTWPHRHGTDGFFAAAWERS